MRRMRNNEMRLVQLDYHRNGVSGNGFHAAVFDWKDPEQAETRRMVAIVFPEQGDCAVLDVAETLTGNVAFARGNSWRGDHFEPWLRKQITRDVPESGKPVEGVA